jgi:3-oxoacyl-[acyl-carrier protein] reductase
MKILITGGSSEIGQAIAKRRHGLGDEIYFTSSSEAHLDNSHKTFSQMGIPAKGFLFDFNEPSAADPNLFKLPIDALVLNAFGKNPKLTRFHELSAEVVRSYFDGNISGNAHLVWRFLPGMVERKFGRLVYVSSLSAMTGTSRYPVYCAAKAALEGLFLNLAVDYGEFNILSNIVRPGVIATERTKRLWSKTYYVDKITEVIPTKQVGTPDQVAEVVNPLLSPTSYMNGSTVTVSGGLPMVRSEGVLDL